MNRLGRLNLMARFASGLYRERAGLAWAGYLQRDPMSLLKLRPGRENPYAVYDQLRAAGPLVSTRQGGWACVSYRGCDSVLRDRRFGRHPAEDRPGMSFLGMNPPDHTRLRRLALPAFTPKAVARYTARMERTAVGLLDEAVAAGRFDLVSGFAGPLPIAVITDLLGIPDSRAGDFERYGRAIGGSLDGVKSVRHARQLLAARADLRRLFEHLFEVRRREPRDDIISHLITVEGEQIQPREMVPMCNLLLVAGFETTVNLISNAMLALLAHPGQWQALCADPDGLAPRVVEEVLRWDPPVQRTSRVALEPVELEGQPVRQGQQVITLIGAANRDPHVYRDPDRFDITRAEGPPHLAFASGIHYCLGHALARAEAAVALRLLAERMPHLTRSGPVRRRNATIIRGPLRLPLTTTRRPAPVPVS
ncbi:MAG: cytochrome P450 [Streptosporangiaceae bacterium]